MRIVLFFLKIPLPSPFLNPSFSHCLNWIDYTYSSLLLFSQYLFFFRRSSFLSFPPPSTYPLSPTPFDRWDSRSPSSNTDLIREVSFLNLHFAILVPPLPFFPPPVHGATMVFDKEKIFTGLKISRLPHRHLNCSIPLASVSFQP